MHTRFKDAAEGGARSGSVELVTTGIEQKVKPGDYQGQLDNYQADDTLGWLCFITAQTGGVAGAKGVHMT